jgi:hypothetical protein
MWRLLYVTIACLCVIALLHRFRNDTAEAIAGVVGGAIAIFFAVGFIGELTKGRDPKRPPASR